MIAVQNWIKKNIAYSRDPEGREVFQTPDSTILKYKAGDCDDHSILAASLLKQLGYRVRLAIIDPRKDRKLSHVYTEVYNPKTNEWLSVETTKDVPLGWSEPYTIKYIVPLDD